MVCHRCAQVSFLAAILSLFPYFMMFLLNLCLFSYDFFIIEPYRLLYYSLNMSCIGTMSLTPLAVSMLSIMAIYRMFAR